MAGVPVIRDEEFGEGGGYRIRSDFFMPRATLTDQECVDLSLVARIAETRSLPLLEEAASVRDKILQGLPLKQQEIIRDASALFDVLSIGMADHAHCSKVMTELQRSLLSKKQIEATYLTPHTKRVKKVRLQPRRVFLSGQCWYLAAHDTADDATNLYRVPRFKAVRVLDQSITLEGDWSLREEIGNAWTVFRGDQDWHIEIEFDHDAAELVREVKWHPTQQLVDLPDGRLLFRATVSGLEELKFWVLGWGPRARVRKPLELEREIKKLASEIVARYDATGMKHKSRQR